MKKSLIIIALTLIIFNTPVEAKTMKVMSLDKFSTQAPLDEYRVQTLETQELEDGSIIDSGTVITGKVIKIEPPKRGKRDSYFEFIPTSYIKEGEIYLIENPKIVAKVVGYQPLDPTELLTSVAKKAANFAVKGASLGISFVEGVVKAEEGERLKSGFVRVYKDSPLSYIEVGDELNIEIGDAIILKTRKVQD